MNYLFWCLFGVGLNYEWNLRKQVFSYILPKKKTMKNINKVIYKLKNVWKSSYCELKLSLMAF